jgi:hypothetical protein
MAYTPSVAYAARICTVTTAMLTSIGRWATDGSATTGARAFGRATSQSITLSPDA